MDEPRVQAACCELLAEVVGNAGEATLKVHGASMMPAIWPGDVLLVKRQPANLFEPGQVVLFRRDGGLVAHRIVRIADDFLLTRGDSLPDPDPPVAWSDVVGRVAGIYLKGRLIALRQSRWQGAIAWALRRSILSERLLLRIRGAARRLSAIPSQQLPR